VGYEISITVGFAQRDLMRIRLYFYVNCGSTTRTFTYVFIHTKTYNIDVFRGLKRKNAYVLTAIKT